MSLIFIGDIAYPERPIGEIFLPKNTKIVANLEGPIIDLFHKKFVVNDRYKYNLFSDKCIVQFFKRYNWLGLSLANNHICDFKHGFENTVSVLKKEGIDFFGTNNKSYMEFIEDNVKYIVIGTVSDLTEPNNNRLHTFTPSNILKLINKLHKTDHTTKIIVYIHWGYELSHFPQPADRLWARKAIENGAAAIIGHHPHVVQGVEVYKNGLIAYSLGNFYLPQLKYLDKTLSYKSPRVGEELGIEFDPLKVENSTLYWFKYDSVANSVLFQKKEQLSKSKTIDFKTPFAGFSDVEYERWFKSQNKLKKGTPIKYPTFYSYSHKTSNLIKYRYIMLLKMIKRILIKVGIYNPW